MTILPLQARRPGRARIPELASLVLVLCAGVRCSGEAPPTERALVLTLAPRASVVPRQVDEVVEIRLEVRDEAGAVVHESTSPYVPGAETLFPEFSLPPAPRYRFVATAVAADGTVLFGSEELVRLPPEGVRLTIGLCADRDGDGFGSPGSDACPADARADCDDARADVRPGAAEVCGDGVDNDCDPATDETDPARCAPTCVDRDGDGYGDPASAACGRDVRDCLDGDPAVHPGATEALASPDTCTNGVDDDCDGLTDGADPGCCSDRDGDGVGLPASPFCPAGPHGPAAADCDDGDPTVSPVATERCGDGVDGDCDGLTDADDPDCILPCLDLDGDGFGDPAEVTCPDPRPDCDDGDALRNPGATERCGNGVDEDCDGADARCTAACTDADGDGANAEGDACGPIDCDDADPDVYPGAPEADLDTCTNDLDDDCDGALDDADGGCCVDADDDGYGAPSSPPFCRAGGGDCDDAEPDAHPGGTERCDDGLDNDCNGLTDGLDPACCVDEDGDGYGSPGSPACARGALADCDDHDPTTRPGALDTCGDGVDQNCDGVPDDGCRPDLVARALGFEDCSLVAPCLRLRFEVANVGDASVERAFDVGLEFTDCTGAATQLCDCRAPQRATFARIPPLAPGERATFTRSFFTFPSAGSSFCVTVDERGEVAESSEANTFCTGACS